MGFYIYGGAFMKKIIFFMFFGLLLVSAGIIGFVSETDVTIKKEILDNQTNFYNSTLASEKGNGVLAHGDLKAIGGKIVDKNGKSVVLKGMSSHGIVWFPQFINTHSIQKTKENGANVFRAAMYTEEYGGYTTGENEKQNSKKLLYQAVDNALSLDIYAIIDWHILNDANPQKHKTEAIAFFDEVSKKYANNPAVIYEICNEPHGVSWKNDIKPYAKDVISVIRKNSPKALIIVGTNTWSQDVDEASEDLLEFENIAYAFHFYAGTHMLDDFKYKIEKAILNGATIFVSEWGITKADGNGGVYFDEARKWLSYLDEKQISRVNWSLCNKNEMSAAVLSGSDSESWGEKDLTGSGKFVFDSFKK